MCYEYKLRNYQLRLIIAWLVFSKHTVYNIVMDKEKSYYDDRLKRRMGVLP